MLESPLIRTLQLLEPEEFDALHSFVVSPVFNDSARSNDAIRLYEQIRGHYPAFDHESLQKEIIGQELFPERNNPAGEVEKAMSELMHVLKQFINYSCFTVQGGKAVRRSSKKDFAENPGMTLVSAFCRASRPGSAPVGAAKSSVFLSGVKPRTETF